MTNLDTMNCLTFDEFAEFIREHWSVPVRKQITPDTEFERDLGLTGDDGDDLLQATEKRFGVALGSEETGVRETFNLRQNEYLFHSEGLDLSPFRFTTLFGHEEPTVRRFTVGELFEAVQKSQGRGTSAQG
jgi:acyl carrier protein